MLRWKPRKPHPFQAVIVQAVIVSVGLALVACESPYATGEPEVDRFRYARTAADLANTSGLNDVDAAEEPNAPPVDGFVVWESSRTGDWRLWIRDLQDNSEPRLLTNEPRGGEQHCCPHISPNGDWIAYLRMPPGQETYPVGGGTGDLYLVRPDGSDSRRLAAARTYVENRAAIWHNSNELVYIGADRRTRRFDITNGDETVLTTAAPDDPLVSGWLVNPTQTHASDGAPTFSLFSADERRVDPQRNLGGCQPYFTHDGNWGFWVAGAGGPFRALDLVTRQERTLLAKSDPRLPVDRGYIYFPMLSRDQRWLVWGASEDDHDHHEADYDLFAAEVDPRSLRVVGPVRRLTEHPATDRFPDIHTAPLALGRFFGEAPFAPDLDLPDGWTLLVNDEERQASVSFEEQPTSEGLTFEVPGVYRLRAIPDSEDRGDERLGTVNVSPAEPPKVTGVELRGTRTVRVHLDEPVNENDLRVSLAGATITASRLDASGRLLELELAADFERAGVLRLSGLVDRAQVPNALPPTEWQVEPPSWPSREDGLLVLWERDGGRDEVVNMDNLGGVRTTVMKPTGRAFYDRFGAMDLRGGRFEVDEASARAVVQGALRTNEMTVEVEIEARGGAGWIFRSAGELHRNFALGTDGERLFVEFRSGQEHEAPRLDLGALPPGIPTHVVVSYTAGRLTGYRDGLPVLDSNATQTGLDQWVGVPLFLGPRSGEADDDEVWQGRVASVALYGRVMEAEEVAENARRVARERARRPQVTSQEFRAELVEKAPVPSLAEIDPYRDALAVFLYRKANGESVAVVHRVMVDGETLPVARRRVGESYDLRLETFSERPRLASLYLSEIKENTAGPLFFDDAIEP